MASVVAGARATGLLSVNGEVRVPGDKSVSHRALIFAALADGTSTIRGLLDSADVRSTAGVLRALGVDLPAIHDSSSSHDPLRIDGLGLRGLRAPANALDCGNSGTTTRLLAGVCAAYPFRTRFEGDASLSRRPMKRIADPLSAMGARVAFDAGDGLPMTIDGGSLRGLAWDNTTGSAQVKSAVLLAGLVAGVPVTVRASRGSRDHTERFLQALGATVTVAASEVSLAPPRRLRPFSLDVPRDPSSAAYFAALAALAGSGSIRLPGVLASPARGGFFETLAAMGAEVVATAARATDIGEATVTFTVSPGPLRGLELGADDIPSMIDEIPLLACVAACASGETRISGAGELRVKESDRIASTVANLRALGIVADERPDGLRVEGRSPSALPLRGAVTTHGDHRIAMAFGVLGAATGNGIVIDDPDCVAVSYPGFWADLAQATVG